MRLTSVIFLACLTVPATGAASEADDASPIARLMGSKIQARYVPQGMGDEASVRKAYEDGLLREPVLPALDLAGDEAFVMFGRFTGSRLGLTYNTLPVCHDADGFRIRTATGEPPPCDQTAERELGFVRQPDGDLVCTACAARGLPAHWQLQKPASR